MPRSTQFAETPEKTKLRYRIMAQFCKWFQNKKVVTTNTLPGRTWLLEDWIACYAWLPKNKNKTIQMNCFEWDTRLRREAPCPFNWHKDNEAMVKHGVLDKVKVKLKTFYGHKEGFFRYHKDINVPCFSWADYCGTPKVHEIEKFKHAIIKDDVVYVTFYLNARYAKTIAPECLSAMQHFPVSDRATLLVKSLEKIIQKKIGNNFTRILFSDYTNRQGERGASPMVTVGWHFVKNSPLAKVK